MPSASRDFTTTETGSYRPATKPHTRPSFPVSSTPRIPTSDEGMSLTVLIWVTVPPTETLMMPCASDKSVFSVASSTAFSVPVRPMLSENTEPSLVSVMSRLAKSCAALPRVMGA